ncbi:type II toxin-antitoxin system VapC family toxin [Conexibacter sp. JD483]|uniref:type II toxin-antitoxin system VapC family toxin n=1 Tax=unclassified Conexibacter TaxID=2627773 RepID=UPI002722826A|nr:MULTISPECIES: type II toxin-antitoxin system VapC family toxin [unclassified Conexibacter]MDO8185352.1 type II toxin-antitoxin system VapC family toxin [Conexibacter sp. CPCC 205706]MDO8198472.1 type II toxin-antitoxin system VapC family toxin [Conexibacter sp. CPCC 205762]MDR9368763.1 type II toxin-antitoxin system VapC family toxin [Conexibacter sp. JD483]
MKLLLDTHAALWWLDGGERVGPRASDALVDSTNEVLLSAAVVWEVAIKRSLGKLRAPAGFAAEIQSAGALPLPVTVAHAEAVEQLPWHHRDPFDRLLIAQALAEGATLVSRDEQFAAYGVPLVW